MADNEALSLIEFTTSLGNFIHSRPELRDVWITAELSDVAVRGGHFYADLIQKDSRGQTVARMRSNLWASYYSRLRQKFFNERQEDLRNGIKVKIKGAATHHNVYGLSFNIVDIDPSYVDEGDILRRRMEILEKMKKEGIFDENRNLTLPSDTQRIAVISAPGAAGLGDFINQMQSNAEKFRFSIKLFESPMQGANAPAGVIAALQRIAEEMNEWDCVVIIRGGGATADMNCFDNEILARNICMFPLPVIVGIGHERDNCVLDYLAHTRCKTPTAVAEFLVSHQRQAWNSVCEKVNNIIRFASLHLDGERQRMTQLESAIPATVNQHIERETIRLKNFTTSIPLAASALTSKEHARLDLFKGNIVQAAQVAVGHAKEKLITCYNLVGVLSPANVLKRGYSVTRINGKAVRDTSLLSPGDIVETQLGKGRIKSKIIENGK